MPKEGAEKGNEKVLRSGLKTSNLSRKEECKETQRIEQVIKKFVDGVGTKSPKGKEGRFVCL